MSADATAAPRRRISFALGTWQLTVLLACLEQVDAADGPPAEDHLVLYGAGLPELLRAAMATQATCQRGWTSITWAEELLAKPTQPGGLDHGAIVALRELVGHDDADEVWLCKLFDFPEKVIAEAFPSASINLYEDGVNFYVAQPVVRGEVHGWSETTRSAPIQAGRWLLGRGDAFWMPGLWSSHQERVVGCWAVVPASTGLPLPAGLRRQVDLDRVRSQLTSVAALAGLGDDLAGNGLRPVAIVLGQSFARWGVMEAEDEANVYRTVCAHLLEDGFEVLWKDHPRLAVGYGPQLFEDLADVGPIGPLPIASHWPAEAVLPFLQPAALVSATSTSLFLASPLFGTPCYSFADEMTFGWRRSEHRWMARLAANTFPSPRDVTQLFSSAVRSTDELRRGHVMSPHGDRWGEKREEVANKLRILRHVGFDQRRWRYHVPARVRTITGPVVAAGEAVTGAIPSIDHVAFYTRVNAGDIVLVSAVRAAFEHACGPVRWTNEHAHWRFSDRAVRRANDADLVVIGGGGLLLADTKPNANSGWQWNAPIDAVTQVRSPMVLFAVGYNRFRGQADFRPVFTRHVTEVAARSEYIGLRNHGSIEALRRYLPEELHHKVRFQPCPTTVLSRIDPTLVTPPPDDVVVGVNLAFDRADLRFGDRADEILTRVGDALRAVESRGARILFYAQCPEDVRALPGLGPLRTLEVATLYGKPPRDVAEAFGRASVVLGMRGHAQMIPFGLRRPIVSLVTHDKLRFFLDDIGRPEWGIEATAPDLTTQLVDLLESSWTNGEAIGADIDALQDDLWETTLSNVRRALPARELEEVT